MMQLHALISDRGLWDVVVWIKDGAGIWTWIVCTLEHCQIISKVQRASQINLCLASGIRFPVDPLWIWFPQGSVQQLDHSLLVALRLLAYRISSRANTIILSPILYSREEKKRQFVEFRSCQALTCPFVTGESQMSLWPCFGQSLSDKQEGSHTKTLPQAWESHGLQYRSHFP